MKLSIKTILTPKEFEVEHHPMLPIDIRDKAKQIAREGFWGGETFYPAHVVTSITVIE